MKLQKKKPELKKKAGVKPNVQPFTNGINMRIDPGVGKSKAVWQSATLDSFNVELNVIT